MDRNNIRALILALNQGIKTHTQNHFKIKIEENLNYYLQIVESNAGQDSETFKHFSLKNQSDLSNFIKKCLDIESVLIENILPIYSSKRKILNAMTYHNLLILQSPTGTGKSSQIPIFFLTSPVFYKSSVYIIQPKKISAISLANKVKTDLKGLHPVSPCTKSEDFQSIREQSIVYFDDNTFFKVLLEERQKDFPFPDSKVVILDDIHELTVDIVMNLGFLLDLIKSKRPDMRVLITSATLNESIVEDYLQNYLKIPSQFSNQPESKLEMKFVSIKLEETQFDVKTIYLTESTNYFKDSLRTVERIILKEDFKKILVFLTCQSELFDMKQKLEGMFKLIHVYLLYAGMNLSDQENGLRGVRPGVPIVVLATNYAESSITIRDLSHVIDCGRERLMIAQDMNIYQVASTLISKSSAIQRRGRAGREAPGICYCMYTEQEFNSMQPFRKARISTDLLDSRLLLLNKNKINIRSLNLLFQASEEQLKLSYNKLVSENAIDFKEELDYLKSLRPIGELALELDVDSKLASMIYRTKFAFEAILWAGALKVYDTLFDARKVEKENEFFFREFDDFTMVIIVLRQYCSIRCEGCYRSGERFNTEDISSYLKFVDNSCKNCQDKGKKWLGSMKFNWRSVTMSLRYSLEILRKLKDKNIRTELKPEHYAMEVEYMNTENNQGHLAGLVNSYKSLANYAKLLFLIVFCSNLCENISSDELLAYRHLNTGKLGVPSSSSTSRLQESGDYIIFYSMELCKSKHYFKYIFKFSAEFVQSKKEILNLNYLSAKDLYEVYSVPNLGEKVQQALKSNGSLYIENLEFSFHNVLTSFLLKYSKEEASLHLMMKKEERKSGVRLINQKVQEIYQIIESKHCVYHSLSDNYLAVIGLGMEIRELITPNNELRYKIRDIDTSTPVSALIKDIKNTFSVKFVSVERIGDQVQAILYFSNQQDVEEAKNKLKLFPLKGDKGNIFQMEPLVAGAVQGIRASVEIPSLVHLDKAQKVFDLFNPKTVKQVRCSKTKSKFILKFRTRQENEYFINNHKHVLQQSFSVSAIEVKLLAEGISLPRDLLKVKGLTDYIERLKISYSCNLKIDMKKGKIYSDFEELPPVAQEKLRRLANNETLEIPGVVWEEVVKRNHYFGTNELNWRDFQHESSVSCVYIPTTKMLQIFGLPEERCEILNYLKQYCSTLMSQLLTVDLKLAKDKVGLTYWEEVSSKFPKLEFKYDFSDASKLTVFGYTKEVNSFLHFFYNGRPPYSALNECQICGRNQSGNTHKLSMCGHTIHKACFEANIMSESFFCIPLKCLLCEQKVSYEDLLMILSYTALQKAEKFALDQFINSSGKEKYAFCEIPRCGFMYAKNAVNLETMLRYCPRCNLQVCIICKEPARKHHNSKCQRKWIRENDKKSSLWLRENTVCCPKCKFSVEKSGGCNHMTCTNCKANYCSICSNLITQESVLDHYLIENSLCYQKMITGNPS